MSNLTSREEQTLGHDVITLITENLTIGDIFDDKEILQYLPKKFDVETVMNAFSDGETDDWGRFWAEENGYVKEEE